MGTYCGSFQCYIFFLLPSSIAIFLRLSRHQSLKCYFGATTASRGVCVRRRVREIGRASREGQGGENEPERVARRSREGEPKLFPEKIELRSSVTSRATSFVRFFRVAI